MNPVVPIIAGLLVSASVLTPSPGVSAPVVHTVTTVNGVKVDRYRWTDSSNRPRSVSLKREGAGNPGHGGYAVQMTYQVRQGAGWRDVVVNAAPGNDGGFGYFVSHERYRDFVGGGNGPIAQTVFGKSDSPLGRNIAVTGAAPATGDPNVGAHRFRQTYPRYGTISPIPKNAAGNDVRRTPRDPDLLKLYQLPITILWVFESGKDYPLIRTTVGLNTVGPDRVNFDLRGPYGVMAFDDGQNGVLDKAMWGDRYHFQTLDRPLTRNSGWLWRARNQGARYQALIAGGFEMGLFEPKRFSASRLVDASAEARGESSDTYNGGNGCPDQDQLIPCDWDWSYQSAQYSLPYDNPDGATDGKKIAWGSAPFWGTGPSLTQVWDTSDTSRPFNGYPASKQITYDICVVLGRTIPGGLTRAAAAGPDYSCAELP